MDLPVGELSPVPSTSTSIPQIVDSPCFSLQTDVQSMEIPVRDSSPVSSTATTVPQTDVSPNVSLQRNSQSMELPVRESSPVPSTSAPVPQEAVSPMEEASVEPRRERINPTRRPRHIDPIDRLVPRYQHFHRLEKIRPGICGYKCRVCYMKGSRKDTSYWCVKCEVYLCRVRNCFTEYHTKVKYW